MILVVGGAGYIGSHMVKLLRDSNESHVVLDSLENGHREAVADSPLVVGDIRNPRDIAELFALYPDVDLVMHFGAYISVGESVHRPGKYYENNVVGSLNLLQAMAEFGRKQIVFSSTAAIFGAPISPFIDESHPRIPLNPYGRTKLMVEEMLGDFERAHGIQSVCLRYFNASGADPSGSIGEDHSPEEHLIPSAILAAMGKRAELKVFGSDYPTGDGTCVRDYIHVTDLCEAHAIAIRHLRNGGNSRRYNLGNGRGFSVRQVIEMTGLVTSLPIPYSLAERREGDSPTLVASSEAITKDWGWKPKRSGLETIIGDAWNWHRTHPDGYSTPRIAGSE